MESTPFQVSGTVDGDISRLRYEAGHQIQCGKAMRALSFYFELLRRSHMPILMLQSRSVRMRNHEMPAFSVSLVHLFALLQLILLEIIRKVGNTER